MGDEVWFGVERYVHDLSRFNDCEDGRRREATRLIGNIGS